MRLDKQFIQDRPVIERELPSDFHKGKIKRNFLKMEANVTRIWNIRCVR